MRSRRLLRLKLLGHNLAVSCGNTRQIVVMHLLRTQVCVLPLVAKGTSTFKPSVFQAAWAPTKNAIKYPLWICPMTKRRRAEACNFETASRILLQAAAPLRLTGAGRNPVSGKAQTEGATHGRTTLSSSTSIRSEAANATAHLIVVFAAVNVQSRRLEAHS